MATQSVDPEKQKKLIEDFRKDWEDQYRANTKKSWERLSEPGADRLARSARYRASYGPYPLYIERGEGFTLHDVDGNTYVDFSNRATALVHGHAHPVIEEAIKEAIAGGTASDMSVGKSQHRLAELITDRMPGVEKLVWSLSGTESDMYVIRIARAYTGKETILRFYGSYHGSYDAVHAIEKHIPGYPKRVEDEMVLANFNDREDTERVILDNKDRLAAVIVEPIMGTAGYVEQRDGFLQWLREITHRHGILLIYDEVITGFRWAPGGAQEYYNITPPPDLSAMGKIMGGGLPSGAVGGREDIMKVVVGEEGRPAVPAGGTLAGNRASTAAGVAALELLTPDVYKRLNTLGSSLRDGFRSVMDELGIRFQITGDASVHSIHPTPEEVRDGKTANPYSPFQGIVRLGLVNRGVIWSSGGFSINTVMTEKEVRTVVDALRDTLVEMKPLLQEAAPEMLS